MSLCIDRELVPNDYCEMSICNNKFGCPEKNTYIREKLGYFHQLKKVSEMIKPRAYRNSVEGVGRENKNSF